MEQYQDYSDALLVEVAEKLFEVGEEPAVDPETVDAL